MSTAPALPAPASRRAFLGRLAGALAGAAAGALLLAPLGRGRGEHVAGAAGACDMEGRDARPYKGFASVREGSGGQCTTYAARRFDTVATEPGVNWSGGARTWFWNAAAAGWRVRADLEGARVSTIVVWDDWDGVSSPRAFNGHCAWVEAVTDDGLVVSEMNAGDACPGQPRWRTTGWGIVATRLMPWDEVALRKGRYRLLGFVYSERADLEG